MTQTQVFASKCVFSVFLLYLTSTRVSAQVMTTACDSESTIVIKFPENDLNVTLPLSDEYVQNVLTNGEPTRVDVNFDPGIKITAKYPFSDYFLTSYNTVQKAFQVRMIKGIDRDGATGTTEDDVNILQYQLVCFPDAAAVSSNSAQYRALKIQILDVNDNTPQFVNAPYSYTVNELTPVDLTVFRGISATDLDDGPNMQIFYSFSSGPSPLNLNGTQYFILPSEQEGIVSVLSPLDFESMYAAAQGDASQVYYNIIVTARDNASPQSAQRTSQTTLKITITDGDDQGPEFIYPSCIRSSQPTSKSCIRPKYLTSVTSGNASAKSLEFLPDPPDSANPSTKVLILMQDRDTLNSIVSCNIIQTEPAGYESYFSSSYIPQYSGKQSLCIVDKVANKPLYRSNLTSLELVLEAVELSPTARVDYATVVVSVELANLNPPTITYNSNTGYIYENSPAGARPFIDATANTTLLKLTFTDPNRFSSDPPVPFTVTVRPENTFGVTQDGYVVLTSGTLDYEIKKSYVYSVTVTSNGLSSSETLTINILDNNDNVPVIQNDDPIVYVTPGIFNNPLTLRKLNASDVDFGPPLFSLLRVFPATLDVKFSVSGDGEVSLQGLIRSTDTYIVYISASDQGTPKQSSDAVVVISANRVSSMFSNELSEVYMVQEGHCYCEKEDAWRQIQ